MSTLNILFQCFPSFQHRYIDDSTSSRRSEVKIFPQNLLPLSSKSIKIKEARWRVSTSLYIVNNFQIQEGRRLCLEAPCVFRSSKIASATLVFFKIQYQPRNVLHGVFNKDPGGRST